MRTPTLAILLTAIYAQAVIGQTRSRPLPVGFLRADGIVAVAFVVTDSAVRPLHGDETFLPDALASQWTILRPDSAPLTLKAGAMVHVFSNGESTPIPHVGQVTDGPRAPDFSYAGDRHVGLALGRSVPGETFRRDSTASPARDSILRRFRAEFVDTIARRVLANFFHRTGPLAPTSAIHDFTIWRAAIPETTDTLYVVQGERWYDEGSTTIFALWGVQSRGRLRIVRRRGPDNADGDYKGSPYEAPWAVFRLDGRTMLVFERQFYEGNVPVLAELLAGDRVRLVPPE